METQISFSDQLNCLFIRRSGKFAAGTLVAEVAEAVSQPEFRRGMNICIDLREVDFSGASYGKISVGGEAWRQLAEAIAPCKIAVIHSSQRGYGIGRQSSAVFESAGLDRRPFTEVGEALAWLDIPVGTETPLGSAAAPKTD